ncbi:MAG: hypothetical protein QXQ25_02145 [Thermoplasmata archaeon]
MIFLYMNATPSGSAENLSTILIVFAIFVLIVTRRVYRGIRGRAYSARRVLTLPVLYILITIAFIVPSAILEPFFFITFIFIIGGLILGIRFGEKVSFFYKNGTLYYKRSTFILFFWLISFIVRITMEFLLPSTFIIDISIDSILALTSGLLIGEAIHIITSKNRFLENDKMEIL